MKIVYEDEKTVCFLVDRPIAEGHMIVTPKEEYHRIDDIPDDLIAHYFYVASFAASALFDSFGAEGTNIIMNETPNEPFSIQISPRKKGDPIDFKWEPKRLSETEMKEAMDKISWEFVPPKGSIPPGMHQVSQQELDDHKDEEGKKEHDQLVKWYQKTP